MSNSPDDVEQRVRSIGPATADMPAVEDPKTYEPTHDLIFTRMVRGAVVKGLQKDGIPSDPKQLNMLLGTLKDIDSAALGQMRIKSEEKTQSLAAEQQALVRELLNNMGGIKPPAKAPGEPSASNMELPDSVEPVREFVAGELEQGTINNTFEDFSRKMGGVDLSEIDKTD